MTDKVKFFIVFISIVFLWVITPVVIGHMYSDISKMGQFGDLYGSINALFSGLAFAGLIYTIYMQREELSLQREELRLQREEMKLSRKELANQAAVQKALVFATIGQIEVSAIQAKIESVKLRSLERPEHARRDYALEILDLSYEIENSAKQIRVECECG